MSIFNRDFYFVPYTKDEDSIPTIGDVMITHLGIVGFEMDNKYHVNEKIGLSEELFKNFKYVFTGHFHKPQRKKNIIYMGSPYQMNFGESGQKKGFVVFDTVKDEFERIWYDEAPKYISINIEDFLEVDVSNSFVKVLIKEKVDNFVQLKHLLYEKGAIEVRPDFEESKKEKETGYNEEIDFNKDLTDMIKEYLTKNIKIDKIDNGKLLDCFEKVLAE